MTDISNRYSTSVNESVIRIDLSGAGTAIIEFPQDAALNSADILRDVADRIINSLPKVGFAVSVIVPIYNEEDILADLVAEFIANFSHFPFQTEFLLCENGSQDQTREIGARLEAEHVNVRLVTISEPSYGEAIKMGIQEASADIVVVFNADLWCTRFFLDAVLLLQSGYDIVIGSKRLVPSTDHRPFVRRAITTAFNLFLNICFGFRGTDTHGMKALRRSSVLAVMNRCYTKKEVFDTELILKAQKAHLRISEIPTEVHDTRPARLSLFSRIPSTLRDLWIVRKTL